MYIFNIYHTGLCVIVTVELKSSPDPIDWHLPSFDNKNFLLSSFDEWLTTQTERKSRIWSTCRKNNIPVTKKYKAPPRNIRTDSKSFYYCTNLKVKVKFSKTDWTRCPAGRIYNFEQSLSWGRQNKEVSGFDKVRLGPRRCALRAFLVPNPSPLFFFYASKLLTIPTIALP